MNITSADRTQNHCGRGLTQCEAKGLRESVVKLQKELRLRKAEAEDALNQLNCFKYLVKKAWWGDAVAALHVAKIVGAAPPHMKSEVDEFGKIMMHVEVKSKVLLNWASLTTRVLREEDSKVQDVVNHLSTQRLANDKNEQIDSHSELLTTSNIKSKKNTNSGSNFRPFSAPCKCDTRTISYKNTTVCNQTRLRSSASVWRKDDSLWPNFQVEVLGRKIEVKQEKYKTSVYSQSDSKQRKIKTDINKGTNKMKIYVDCELPTVGK